VREQLSQKYPQAIWGNALSREGVAALRARLAESASTVHVA